VNPKAKIQIVGKRPGEKTHEALFSADESEQAVEFADYYLIAPFYRSRDAYLGSGSKKGVPVTKRWEYSSGTNERFLSTRELAKLSL
jgi:UDP-N-acetylglucosamine 4,6-dehydratase/5-epimerase